MGDGSRSMQAFGALPEAAALGADPRPAWIWSADGSRILWANAAGGRRLGAQCLSDLDRRRYSDSHPLRRDLQNAARIAEPDGTVARLRLLEQPRAVPIACRVRRIAAPDGGQGILVVAEIPGEAACAAAPAVLAGYAAEEARCADAGSGQAQAGPDEAPDEAPDAASGEPVRSPIPAWMRARLATFPPAARRADRDAAAAPADGPGPGRPAPSDAAALAAGPQHAPAAAALSPEERAAFEEIAAALGTLGAGRQRLPLPAADDDAGPPRAATDAGPPPPRPGPAPDAVPSAFCGVSRGPAAASLPTGAVAGGRGGEAAGRLDELTAILDIATDGVVILDGDGRIESLNGSAEALFGRRQAEVAGRAFAELLAPDSRPAATRYFADVKADGLAGLINEGRELEAQADGGTMPLFVTFGRIGGAMADRFCAVIRDLTQWKQAEAELIAARRKAEEASSQKSDFLARISHEIRTPLNGIIGFADVILEERFGRLDSDRYREYMRDIRTSGEHVLSLVNDLLDIAKIEAGKLELNLATIQLNQLVRECVMLMQPAASRSRIILRTSLASDLPAVRADARTIRQVVLNILSNAVKFTGPGGQAIVSTGRRDGGVVLKVRDTGEGMSETELVRALEPFRQLATASLGDRTGTGLGLPLTKALVEANRASFAITSAKGEGTIVRVGFSAASVVADPS